MSHRFDGFVERNSRFFLDRVFAKFRFRTRGRKATMSSALSSNKYSSRNYNKHGMNMETSKSS